MPSQSTIQEPDPSAKRRRASVWGFKLVGTFIGAGLAVWIISRYDMASLWPAFRSFNLLVASALIPFMLINLVLRAARWRILLGTEGPGLWATFSALMIGQLANLVTPARGGDLVRVYILGNTSQISRSAILATVLVERVIDLLAMSSFLAATVYVSGAPVWMQQGGLLLGTGAMGVILVLIVASSAGEPLIAWMLQRARFLPPSMIIRIRIVLSEFLSGIVGLRVPRQAASFLLATAFIWVTEILVLWVVARAFGIDLSMFDSWILMLFAAFSSLIPAMPGQLGAFEFAVVSGADWIGRTGPEILAFALGWHFVLLAGTCLVGTACLIASGKSLLPRSRRERSPAEIHPPK